MVASVADGGPVLREQWANISCYQGYLDCPATGGGVTLMAPAGDAAKWTLCTYTGDAVREICWVVVGPSPETL